MTEELGPITVDARDSGRSRRRVWWFGCSGLFLVCLGLVVVLLLRDGPPPDDADLLPPPRVVVPDAENLYAALAALHPRYSERRDYAFEVESEGEFPEGPWPDPWSRSKVVRARWSSASRVAALTTYFEEFDPVLAKVATALELSACQFPWLESSIEIDDSTDREVLLDAHRQFSLRAVLQRARGDVQGASRDLATALRFGDAMLDHAEGIHHVAFGLSMVVLCWERLECLLYDGELAPDIEATLLVRQTRWMSDPEWMTLVLRHDYRLQRASTERLARGELEGLESAPGLLLRWQFPRNRALARFAEVYRELIELSNKPPSERVLSTPRPANELSRFDRRVVIEPLAQMTLMGNFSVLQKTDRARLAERAGRTLVALRVHERTHGALPADLDALVRAVPALGSVPIDPWPGAPLRYDPARRILWSVGEDGIDGDGDGLDALRDDPGAERYEHPDWVWPIPPLPGGG